MAKKIGNYIEGSDVNIEDEISINLSKYAELSSRVNEKIVDLETRLEEARKEYDASIEFAEACADRVLYTSPEMRPDAQKRFELANDDKEKASLNSTALEEEKMKMIEASGFINNAHNQIFALKERLSANDTSLVEEDVHEKIREINDLYAVLIKPDVKQDLENSASLGRDFH